MKKRTKKISAVPSGNSVSSAGRPNQRMRTRKDLLQAASRLMKQGRKPTLEEIAEDAMVSRATAYRYFPNVEALYLEASIDLAAPQPDDLFRPGLPDDPLSRIERVDTAFHDMSLANESALRMMLANSLERRVRSDEGEDKLPIRQNRRAPLIELAFAPARKQFHPQSLDALQKILAILIGTESMVVCKDVLQISDAEARAAKRWAIRALVEAAMK